MSTPDEWRERLGRYGIWRRNSLVDPPLASRLEELGFGSLWLGGSPSDDLQIVEDLLDATTTLIVATGIVNIWTTDPQAVAASHKRIVAKHPDRFILGIGAGHPENTGKPAEKPYAHLVESLDALEAAGVPRDELALAALGPRVLQLSADRTLGAHPYLTTAEHSRRAREQLGPVPLIVPEERVVLEVDADAARAIARPPVKPYLNLVNYVRNLRRLGYTDDDLSGDGSDRLIDDLVAYGTPQDIKAHIDRHLDAGADHVVLQLLPTEQPDLHEAYGLLAADLGLSTGS